MGFLCNWIFLLEKSGKGVTNYVIEESFRPNSLVFQSMKSDLCTISLNVKYSTRTFEILSKSTIVNEFSSSLSCHNVLHYENVSSDWYLALSTC